MLPGPIRPGKRLRSKTPKGCVTPVCAEGRRPPAALLFSGRSVPGTPAMQSTATGPVPAAPARAGRPQAVSCRPPSLDRIAREPGPAFSGSGSPRLDSPGVSGGEGLKPSPAASPLFSSPSFRPGAAPPTPSFRPSVASGEIFQPRRRVRSTALERFLHSAPCGAPVEMTGRRCPLRSAPCGAPVEMTGGGRSLRSAPCGAPVETTGRGRSLRAVRGGMERVTG